MINVLKFLQGLLYQFRCTLSVSLMTYFVLASFLFPTRTEKAVYSLCWLQSSNHFQTFQSDLAFAISYTKIQRLESFRQLGIKLLKRYCPAVSQSCSLQFLFWQLKFRTKKSIPIVALSISTCTLQLVSKRSFINRSIIEVLPTCWSPKSTILYLILPPTVEEVRLIESVIYI